MPLLFAMILFVLASTGVTTPVLAESIAETLMRIESQLSVIESSTAVQQNSAAEVAARQVSAEERSRVLRDQIERHREAIDRFKEQIYGYIESGLSKGLPATPVVPDSPAVEPGTPRPATVPSVPSQLPAIDLATRRTPLEGSVAGMERRVLTRPDAVLYRVSGETLPLDTFSILYVYEDVTESDGTRWLAVGSRVDKIDGWVRHDATEDWRSMLVMEYGPRTNVRKPVLFFSTKEQLAAVVSAADGPERVETLYGAVASGDNVGGRIVTVEPNRSVRRDETYLMPILDYESTYFSYGDYADVTLLQLAGITDESVSRQTVATGVGEFNARPEVSKSLERFRIGVAFVIDTTRSMGPYINATKDFVRNVYSRLAANGLEDKFRFGLVGFRDNIKAAPGADYVTRVFNDLDGRGKNRDFWSKIDAVAPAEAPTVDWREDAFAGLRTAAYDLDWSQVDARIVVLITDASARSETDEKARHQMFGAWSVRAIMDQHDIAVFSVHLRTEEARRVAGEAEIIRGQVQYRTLGRYLPVEGDTTRAFGRALDSMENLLVQTLSDAAAGREIEDQLSADDHYKVIDVLLGRGVVTEDTADIVAKPIASEIFRFQQAYLGEYEGVKPPKFYRAWAADRDLLSQSQEALTVSVLVSRGQLELLADALERIVADVDAKEMNLSEFHSGTRQESGRTTVDPRLPDVAKEFLEALPYKSKFLQLTGEGFRGLGQGQQDLLNEVRAKLSGYREILSSDRRWMRVSEASEEELYPLPLRNLP